MKKILFIAVAMLLLLTARAQAQYKVVGKVSNAFDGKAVEGVSVNIEGSTLGTITGANGVFEISLPAEATLIFDHLGFKHYSTIIKHPGLDTLRIALEASYQQLEEVIVNTGYQQLNKERATGSFVQL
ncbi:MAG: hypothetical protein EOO87_14140, partial [Pedobacter sp.]